MKRVPIKQGHTSLLEYRVGSDSSTEYMALSKKPIKTKIDIRRIRPNEPDKKIEDNDPYVIFIRNMIFQGKDKIMNAIHVVRSPIQFGTWYTLIDGHHRLKAAKLAGLMYVEAIELHHTDVKYGSVPE